MIMTNWASTSYCIEGSKENLKKIFKAIDGFMTEKRKPKDEKENKGWEGNVLEELGASEEQMKTYYLRGFIQTYELDNNVLKISAEEAWGVTDFRKVLEILMPELIIYYCVEETGCEIYQTNDINGKHFKYNFLVDCCVKGEYQYEEFETKEQTMKFVANLLEKEEVTEEEVEDWNDEHQNDDDYINIHEFEYAE